MRTGTCLLIAAALLPAGCTQNIIIPESRYHLNVSIEGLSTDPYYSDGTIVWTWEKFHVIPITEIGGTDRPRLVESKFHWKIDRPVLIEKSPNVWTHTLLDSAEMDDDHRVTYRFMTVFPPGMFPAAYVDDILLVDVLPGTPEVHTTNFIFPLGTREFDTISVSEELEDVFGLTERHIGERYLATREIGIGAYDAGTGQPIDGPAVKYRISGSGLRPAEESIDSAIARTVRPSFPPVPTSFPSHLASRYSRESFVAAIESRLRPTEGTLCREYPSVDIDGGSTRRPAAFRFMEHPGDSTRLHIEVTADGYRSLSGEVVLSPDDRYVEALMERGDGNGPRTGANASRLRVRK